MSSQGIVFKNPILPPMSDEESKRLLYEMHELGFMWGMATTCVDAYRNLRHQSYDFMRMQLTANLETKRMKCYIPAPQPDHWANLTLLNNRRQFVEYCRRATRAAPPF